MHCSVRVTLMRSSLVPRPFRRGRRGKNEERPRTWKDLAHGLVSAQNIGMNNSERLVSGLLIVVQLKRNYCVRALCKLQHVDFSSMYIRCVALISLTREQRNFKSCHVVRTTVHLFSSCVLDITELSCTLAGKATKYLFRQRTPSCTASLCWCRPFSVCMAQAMPTSSGSSVGGCCRM